MDTVVLIWHLKHQDFVLTSVSYDEKEGQVIRDTLAPRPSQANRSPRPLHILGSPHRRWHYIAPPAEVTKAPKYS